MISGSWPYHEYLSIQPEIAAAEPYCTLLEVSESIALHRDLSALFHDLAQRLHRVVSFDYLNLLLYEPSRNTMRLHVLVSANGPDPDMPPLEFPPEESPSGWVFLHQEPLVISDIRQETRWPVIMDLLKTRAVRWLPLTMAQHRLGALVFGFSAPPGPAEAHLNLMSQIAAQVAVAVDNALNFENAEKYQGQWRGNATAFGFC